MSNSCLSHFGLQLVVATAAMLSMLNGCGQNKRNDQNKEISAFLLHFDDSRFVFRGCLCLESREVLQKLLLEIIEKEKLGELLQERSDYFEVTRVASEEISLIEKELTNLESLGREKTAKFEELQRARSAEVNALWSSAVSATDKRFAERARRFQVMLATRMMERGVVLFAQPVLLEPQDAAKIFEAESKKRGYWNEDEKWLQRQLEAWNVYEEAWRQARTRIRREVEKTRTDSLAKLLQMEEAHLRDAEKSSSLRARREQLLTPLREAWQAVAKIEKDIALIFHDCVSEFFDLWAAASCDAISSTKNAISSTKSGLLILTENGQGKLCFLLFEDAAGMQFFDVFDARESSREQNNTSNNVKEWNMSPRPLFEILK